MMHTAAGLEVHYLPFAELAAFSPAWWEDVLGIVAFDAPAAIERNASERKLDIPVAASRTPVLGSSSDLCEVWRVPRPPAAVRGAKSTEHAGRVVYRHDGDLLFGQIALPESLFDERESSRLKLATQSAYQEIFATLEIARYPHLVRVWNYLPAINVEDHGTERYRHFNTARQAAFTGNGRPTGGNVPAASALGSLAGGPLSIYFLAARQAPTMIENPRQVSAYHYPPEYGKHSPTFSRACLLHRTQGTTLFISGTASIVGHRTLHAGDVVMQAHESLANIESLVAEANRAAAPAAYRLRDLKYKVYVRVPADLPHIAAALRAKLGEEACIVFLQADVCREDLLVEIEAAGEARRERAN